MARLFKRLQDLFATNLDELLDRESTREQLLQQVNAGISSTREALQDAQQSQQQLMSLLHQHRQQAQRWRQRAAQALHQDDEAQAREALSCQRDIETLVAILEQARQQLRQTCERLQGQHQALEQQLAKTRRYPGDTPSDDTQGGGYEFLGRMGARLADMGASLGRQTPDPKAQLAQSFRDIEQDAKLESALAALRQELDRE